VMRDFELLINIKREFCFRIVTIHPQLGDISQRVKDIFALLYCGVDH
jgi:hypothetical protein